MTNWETILKKKFVEGVDYKTFYRCGHCGMILKTPEFCVKHLRLRHKLGN